MAYHPLPISTGFDKRYSCHRCEIEDLDRNKYVNERNWTCHHCGTSVSILLADDAGNSAEVMRHQAQHLKAEHYVYLEHNWADGALRVLESEPAAKASMWSLALKNYRRITVEPDRYFNCVISGDMI